MFKKIPTLPGYYVDWKSNSVWNDNRKKMVSVFMIKNPKCKYCTPGIAIKKVGKKWAKNYSIGRLVLIAKTWVDLSSSKVHTCHIDGNPFNNKPSNLRWDTISGNAKDVHKPGTQKILHIS